MDTVMTRQSGSVPAGIRTPLPQGEQTDVDRAFHRAVDGHAQAEDEDRAEPSGRKKRAGRHHGGPQKRHSTPERTNLPATNAPSPPHSPMTAHSAPVWRLDGAPSESQSPTATGTTRTNIRYVTWNTEYDTAGPRRVGLRTRYAIPATAERNRSRRRAGSARPGSACSGSAPRGLGAAEAPPGAAPSRRRAKLRAASTYMPDTKSSVRSAPTAANRAPAISGAPTSMTEYVLRSRAFAPAVRDIGDETGAGSPIGQRVGQRAQGHQHGEDGGRQPSGQRGGSPRAPPARASSPPLETLPPFSGCPGRSTRRVTRQGHGGRVAAGRRPARTVRVPWLSRRPRPFAGNRSRWRGRHRGGRVR